MDEMSKEDIREYVGIIYDMHQNKLVQDNLRNSLEKQISALGVMREYPEPPPKPKPTEAIEKPHPWVAIGAGIVALVVAFFAIGFIFAFIDYGLDFRSVDGFSSKADTILNVLLGLAIAIVVISVCINIYIERKDYKQGIHKRETVLRENQEAEIEYEKRLREYTESQKKRIDTIEIPKKKAFQEALDQLNAKAQQSDECLQKMLNCNILYEKYRDFPAVASIYEYFQTGRCKTLGEAYNLYENELKAGTIINQLNQVLSNLQAIRQNQFALYQAVNTGNQLAAKILENTTAIRENTGNIQGQLSNMAADVHTLAAPSDYGAAIEQKMDIIAYNEQRTRQELEYLNLMNYYDRKYDNNTYGFKPPSVRSIGESIHT